MSARFGRSQSGINTNPRIANDDPTDAENEKFIYDFFLQIPIVWKNLTIAVLENRLVLFK